MLISIYIIHKSFNIGFFYFSFFLPSVFCSIYDLILRKDFLQAPCVPQGMYWRAPWKETERVYLYGLFWCVATYASLFPEQGPSAQPLSNIPVTLSVSKGYILSPCAFKGCIASPVCLQGRYIYIYQLRWWCGGVERWLSNEDKLWSIRFTAICILMTCTKYCLQLCVRVMIMLCGRFVYTFLSLLFPSSSFFVKYRLCRA